MTRFFSFCTMLIALLAVTVPSAAVASRGFVVRPTPLIAVTTDGHYVKAPCLLGGGQRLIDCRTDLGILPAPVLLQPAAAVPAAPPLTDLMPGALVMGPGLPPPRRS